MAPLTTWAGNHTYRASTVHRPTSIDELRAVVTSSPRVRALGSRHSFNDVADGEALLSLDAMPPMIEVDPATATVRVGAGVRYGTLATHLHARGWALHNLASLPHISVAGAVATATHGSGVRSRNLAAAVVGLELVTADGGLCTIGSDDPDLPGSVVALGALGVVTALVLRVEPTYEVAQEVDTDLPWDTALAHLDEVMASADSVSLFTDWRGPAVAQVWRKRRVGPVDADRSGPRHLGAVAATTELHPLPGVDPVSTTAQLGVPGPWHERLPHFRMEFTPSHGDELQSEYLLPREHAAVALQAVRAMAERVAPLLLVSEIRTVAADELWLSTAHRRDSVALHFTWQPRQPEVEALLPALEEALLPFAPRPHWGKLFSAEVAGSPAHLTSVYPHLDDFRALAARLDPTGRFHNEFLLRHGLVHAPR